LQHQDRDGWDKEKRDEEKGDLKRNELDVRRMGEEGGGGERTTLIEMVELGKVKGGKDNVQYMTVFY
jgi:hypothetical protein